ncbi:MAG: putative molybdenum carrier protein [Verrucomicrobiae bacterium]|nr:putative molybdenum carrier protein [Verrucomicrobiae bacterium]
MTQNEKPGNSGGFIIISGGQTGADRAALDFAIENGIPHGGWCPAGRKAEDGIIPPIYNLKETKSSDYPPRTKKNIIEADVTVVFTMGGKFDRGTALTVKLLKQLGKSHIVISGVDGIEKAAEMIDEFLAKTNPRILNVAGPRQSSQPSIYEFVIKVLQKSTWLKKQGRYN